LSPDEKHTLFNDNETSEPETEDYFAKSLLLKGTLNVAIVVGISLMAITILSTIFGAFLPLLFKALGFDPAMMSAPLSATIVDVIGVLIYLEIARVML
jgi:magnesium transporter